MNMRVFGILIFVFIFALPTFAQNDSSADARVMSISVDDSDGVVVTIEGQHPDSCTSLGDITQTVEDDTIFVMVGTMRPADAMCATVLTPFDTEYTLDTSDIEAGDYTLNVNGVTEVITIGAEADSEEDAEVVFDCTEPTEGTLLYDDNGVCFLYPDEYSVIAGRSFILVSQPLTGNPILVVEIDVLDAEDPLTLDDIRDELSDADVDLAIEDLFIGGESAVVVDYGNSREAFVIANDMVFRFAVEPILEDNTGEILWSLAISTAVFPVDEVEEE